MWVFTAERGIRYTRQKILVGSGPLKGFVDNKKTMEYNRPLTQVDPNFSMTRNTLNTAISCLYCVCVRVQKHVFIVVILIHIQFPYNFPGRSRTHKVSSPHFEQHTSVRISPLLMKQQLMSIWRNLIVTIFTSFSMRCSSDGVNPSGTRRCNPAVHPICPLPTRTHSILTHPPPHSVTPPLLIQPEKTGQPGLLSLTLFHLFSHVLLCERATPVDYTEVGRNARLCWRQLQPRGNITDDW